MQFPCLCCFHARVVHLSSRRNEEQSRGNRPRHCVARLIPFFLLLSRCERWLQWRRGLHRYEHGDAPQGRGRFIGGRAAEASPERRRAHLDVVPARMRARALPRRRRAHPDRPRLSRPRRTRARARLWPLRADQPVLPERRIRRAIPVQDELPPDAPGARARADRGGARGDRRRRPERVRGAHRPLRWPPAQQRLHILGAPGTRMDARLAGTVWAFDRCAQEVLAGPQGNVYLYVDARLNELW